MNKKLIYSLAVIAILGLGVAGYASAGQTEETLLCERFAERFNLDAGEVQTFLQENKVQMQDQKFDRMVEMDKITEEQKSLMLQKKEEMSDEFEALKGLEPEERRAKMQELKQEMQEWAEENDIDWGFKGKGPLQRGPHAGPKMGLGGNN